MTNQLQRVPWQEAQRQPGKARGMLHPSGNPYMEPSKWSPGLRYGGCLEPELIADDGTVPVIDPAEGVEG